MCKNIIHHSWYIWNSWRYISLFALTILLLSFIPLSNQDVAYSYISGKTINFNCAQKPICLKNNEIVFLDSYQKQVSLEIAEADKELIRTAKLFSIPYNPQIGISYFHQGQNNWTVRLVYGGIVLETTDKTIYSTQEIYLLKTVFETTDKVILNGKSYQTTRSVRQLGPILHE